MDIFPVLLKLYPLGCKEWVPPQLPFTLAEFCHGPWVQKKKKKDEEGARRKEASHGYFGMDSGHA